MAELRLAKTWGCFSPDLGVENRRVKLASGGMDHYLDIAMVHAIKDNAVCLTKTAEETVRTWH